jgi:hypothetical protein
MTALKRVVRISRQTTAVLALVAATVLVAGACLPAQPSGGRGTPVKRVLVMGDSLVHGLFGTTPKVTGPLTSALADRGVQVRFDGFPGETPIDTWPTNSTGWIQRMQAQISSFDPDMVVIQSMLFPDPGNPSRQALYQAAVGTLLDIAQSRGAHVYLVNHHSPPGAFERLSRDVAQSIQARVAAGRGISTIPLDWWLANCAAPYVPDGWHLSAQGQNCHTLAVVSAVDQLRGVNG